MSKRKHLKFNIAIIYDNWLWHFFRCRLFGWTFSCHFLGRVHRIFSLSRCSSVASSVPYREDRFHFHVFTRSSMYDFHIFTVVYSPVYGFIWTQNNGCWLVSSVGRTLHRYLRYLKYRIGLNFFQAIFLLLLKKCPPLRRSLSYSQSILN